MNSRDTILASVRANAPRPERPLPPVPKFDEKAPADLIEAFEKMLTRMGGRLLSRNPATDLQAAVQPLLAQSPLVCSATPEVKGSLDLSAATTPRMLADVDQAVLRAACGIAETGSVLLTDKDLKVNALAY